MSIGYASLTVGVPQTDLKSCILKNANEANLLQLISHNLRSLARMIDYNEKNNIMLFRISSSLIPFGSSPANKLPWWTIFSSQFQKIGAKICNSKMRVSLHPGQYTVLNSPNEEIVARAMADLQYHNQVLTSLGVGPAHKIVLHIGGVYQDKQQASKRFIANYQHLDQAIKERLVLENDDKLYNIEDVLEIATAVNAPVIFDNLHHAVNPDKHKKNDSYWIHACRKTWQKKDGKQKIHYSQQNQLKKTGSHSASIKVSEFMDFYDSVSGNNLDIMLEVKDKNISAVKCINCTSTNLTRAALELEWSRYKYLILEASPVRYHAMEKLLNGNSSYPALAFYNDIEEALQEEKSKENFLNAAQQIWHAFEHRVSPAEVKSIFKSMGMYKENQLSSSAIKNRLWKIAVKYQQENLVNSYYFVM